MGVDFRWEIDAAEDQARQGGEAGRKGGRLRARLLLPVFFALVCALIAAGIHLRLREVNQQQEALLRAGVAAEVTALRLGDENAFLQLQDGVDARRQQTWRAEFDAWQARKLEGDDPPGGGVHALALDGERAWVQVEETINGEARLHTWFYRLTAEGWRRVSAAAGWRGAARSWRGEQLRIDYDDIDASLVAQLAPQLEAWLALGCGLLACEAAPLLKAQVVAQAMEPSWSTESSWLLLLPSPAAGMARPGATLEPELRESAAHLLAGRLLREQVGEAGPGWTREAAWLRASAGAWLAGRMLARDGGQRLLESLSTHYGEEAVARVMQALHPGTTLQLLVEVTGADGPHAARLDWSDLLAWQLGLEADLRRRGERDAFLSLYDGRDESLAVLARARYTVGEFNGPPTVENVAPVAGADGSVLLRADVRHAGGVVPVQFRWVEGRWLRAG